MNTDVSCFFVFYITPHPPSKNKIICAWMSPRAQLAIEARVTSDDLMQATTANADKIAALQSSIECAISDNFRRVQNMVHSQVSTHSRKSRI